jgi:hypothetical protein
VSLTWFQVSFATPKVFLHSVTIYPVSSGGKFDLKWQKTDDTWHDCPGSPYYYILPFGEHSCFTNFVNAKAIKTKSYGGHNLYEVIVNEIKKIQVDGTADFAMSETTTISGTGLDSSLQTTYARACNALGCSTTTLSVSTSIPEAPSRLDLQVKDSDVMGLTIGAPENNGGALLGYKVYTFGTAAVTSSSGAFSSAPESNCYDGDTSTLCGTDYTPNSKFEFLFDETVLQKIRVDSAPCNDANCQVGEVNVL